MSIGLILSKQNPDGGWPYLRGKSWTEPTVYAVIASLSAGEPAAADRGIQWIVQTGRSDGGWAPQPGVEESTWVTGLVALLPPELLGTPVYERAVRWLTATSGHETSAIYRVRQWLIGIRPPVEQQFSGWPWVPGAAAWVGPTSVALLALTKAESRSSSYVVRHRLTEGREFLLTRMCQDGGWNHGSARPLGYESVPYPETTGMALAALRGLPPERIEIALQAAHRFLSATRSADALNWLRLGLAAHNRLPPDYRAPGLACRTIPEASLNLLALQSQSGRSPFWI